MRHCLISLAAALLATASIHTSEAVQSPANRSRMVPPTEVRTGRYIIRLKVTPPPPKLLRIQDHLEGQYRKGGKSSPYIVVTPKRPGKFTLPAQLRTSVDYVEPEVWMYAVGAGVRREALGVGKELLTANAQRPTPRRSIGEAASGSRERVPQAEAVPSAVSIPNDTHFSRQWGMLDSGFGIRLPSARRWTRGAGITVGIVDSGVRRDLSDVTGGNFLPSYDAINTRLGGTDDNGHGTHVFGTIAQVTDNRIGCAGVAPAARILSVKALDVNGRGTNFTIASGIRYCVDQGCSVINLSIGGSPSRTLADAVTYARSKEVLLVCSSGNGGNATLTYPAAYSDTLSVGAIESNGQRADFSQYGAGLGIVAPGVNILQQTFSRTTRVPGYYYFSGTSMAAPMVSGVAALAKSLRPALTRAELKLLLMGTAVDLGPRGVDVQYGSGLVNAAAACERAAGSGGSPPAPTPTPVPPVDPVPTPVPTPPADPGAEGIVAEVLLLVNEERAKVGAPALTLHPQLNTAAATHAADMRARGQLSHTGSDGSNPGQRMTRAGYPWIAWSENIAVGYPTAAAVMAAWMNSSGHRANILNGNFRELGVAKDGNWWCQVFGARR